MAAILDSPRRANSAVRAFTLALGFVALVAGLLASIALAFNGVQNLLLGGLIAFSLPLLPGPSSRKQQFLALVTFSAVLSLAANLLKVPADMLDSLVLLALIGAFSIWIGSTNFIALIPASAVIVPLMIAIPLLTDQASSRPPIALIAALAAAASLASAAVPLPGLPANRAPTNWVVENGEASTVIRSARLAQMPVTLSFLGAALMFTLTSMTGDSVWTTAGIMLAGTAGVLARIGQHTAAWPTDAIVAFDLPRAATALLALISGSAGLVALATTQAPYGWQIGGAIFAGLFGLGCLLPDWWQGHRIRNEQLRRATSESRTDPLTGLLNRRVIDRRLQEELARSHRYGHPLSVMLIDLDDFKSINDRYGHATGDAVLRGVARSIERSIRSIDIAGRYGGEEFLVLLPETAVPGAEVVAQRIRTSVEHVGHITASIGLASFTGEATTAAAITAAADAALYQAKRSGKNRVVSSR